MYVEGGAVHGRGEAVPVVVGEPAHEEVGGFKLRFAYALTVAVADLDEGLAGLGDLKEGLEELLVSAGVAAVLEGVKVAFGRS